MSDVWLQILAQQVAKSASQADVARELGISQTSLSLVLSGKYPASTDAMERKILAIYGTGGKVNCPALGQIEPGKCATNWEQAKKLGVRVSNPAKLRLFKTCLRCSLRNT